MWWKYFNILLLLCYCAEWKLVSEARQYDVNAEAIKLYGEDLNTVLKRFRRSPEYMKILKDRVDEMMSNTEDMMIQVEYAYKTTKLYNKINESIYADNSTMRRSWESEHSVRRQHFDMPFSADEILRWNQAAREGDDAEETTTLSPVEILDAHEKLHSPFTVAERNSFKDIGFDVAGDAINKMIEAMGPQEDHSDRSSTRMPEEVITTTVTENEVTTEKPEDARILRADDAGVIYNKKATYGYRVGKTPTEKKVP